MSSLTEYSNSCCSAESSVDEVFRNAGIVPDIILPNLKKNIREKKTCGGGDTERAVFKHQTTKPIPLRPARLIHGFLAFDGICKVS